MKTKWRNGRPKTCRNEWARQRIKTLHHEKGRFCFYRDSDVAMMSAFTMKAKLTDEYILKGDRYELVSDQPEGGN